MTADFQFTRATKKALKARIALNGPSGSGKTFTALITARALAGTGGRVAVIDTERMSASLYADQFAFDTLNMHTFAPLDLVKALASAGAAGYDVVIIDSLSHFWMGTGGMLEQVDNAAKRSYGGNSFGGWKEARPMERQMVDAILAYPGHVIVTMRTKTEWVLDENEKGKKTPKRVGTKPEQRDGIEYEVGIVGELDLEHNLVITKSRAVALADKVFHRPGTEFGDAVLTWLADGAEEAALSSLDWLERITADGLTYADYRDLHKQLERVGMLGAPVLMDGEAVSLGDIVIGRGTAARADEEAALAAATDNSTGGSE